MVRHQGDVSRKRRLFGAQAKRTWYATYRSYRFARHFGCLQGAILDYLQPRRSGYCFK